MVKNGSERARATDLDKETSTKIGKEGKSGSERMRATGYNSRI